MNAQKRLCDQKAKYFDRKEAKGAAKEVLKKHGKVMTPYKCNEPLCSAWHLTSVEKGKARVRQAAIRKHGDVRKEPDLIKKNPVVQENIATKDLSELIIDCILSEPHLQKDILKPKIRALINGFKLNLSATNYEKQLTPSKTADLIRKNELHNKEKYFWKDKLKFIVGTDQMEFYYKELDLERKKW